MDLTNVKTISVNKYYRQFLSLLYLMFILSGNDLFGQSTVSANAEFGRIINEQITIDFKTGTISPQSLPFDVPFILTGTVPKQITGICLEITKVDGLCENCEVKSWKLSFLNLPSDDAKTNTFSLRVPKLEPNQSYLFNFDFERSTVEENAQLSALFKPSIRAQFFNESYIRDIDIARGEFAEFLQKHLYEIFKKYYQDHFLIELKDNELNEVILHPDQEEIFRSITSSSQFEGEDIKSLFEDLTEINQDAVSYKDEALKKWISLRDDSNYSKLVSGLSGLTNILANDKQLLNDLILLNVPDLVIDDLSLGRADISSPYQNLLEMPIRVREHSSIEPYKTNISNLLAKSGAIVNHIRSLLLDNEKRQRVLLGEVDAKKLRDLIATWNNNSLTTDQFRQMEDFQDKDKQVRESLTGFINKFSALTHKLEGVKSELVENQKVLKKIEALFQVITSNFLGNIKIDLNSDLTTTADYETRTGYYVFADAGLANVVYRDAFSNAVVPYIGVSFNFAPINRQKKYRWKDGLLKNTAFMLGVSLQSLSEGALRKDTYGSTTLLTGIGVRVSDPIRFSVGAVWNKVSSGNSLVPDERLRAYPYVSLSFDLDVGKYLGKVGNSIFGLKN